MKNSSFFSSKVNKLIACICLLSLIQDYQAAAQAELMPWGNIVGYRIDGQLMEFESSLLVVKNNWQDIAS